MIITSTTSYCQDINQVMSTVCPFLAGSEEVIKAKSIIVELFGGLLPPVSQQASLGGAEIVTSRLGH